MIPKPSRVEYQQGEFCLLESSIIWFRGEQSGPVAELLAEYLRPATGFRLPVQAGNAANPGDIALYAEEAALLDDADFTDERYECSVDTSFVRLSARNGTGLARAVQLLRQLLPHEVFSDTVQALTWSIPCIHIIDQPRFRWRGLHLDVARHFFSLETIYRFIDLIALHRFNVLHLHLTDDQGWRIDIKKYPKLVEVGSMRECTLIGHELDRPRRYNDTPHGGYYTHNEVSRIVAYAEQRHVTILPEIDMPGHCQAVVAAYPEFGNTGQQLKTRCHWGISPYTLNINESTIDFCRDVLDEVIELFPSRFIHIGGDEAPRDEWSESSNAQNRMRELGLNKDTDVQAWFNQQLHAHITARGRRMIGWDEILEGDLSQEVSIMSWQDTSVWTQAAKRGHDVVMASSNWLYFDHYQSHPIEEEPQAIGGMISTDRVYACDPVGGEQNNPWSDRLLGAQGQLWTEYMPDARQLEYMAFPRVCALSEVLWCQPEIKNYTDFLDRLSTHRLRLNQLGVNAHPRP